MMYLVFTFCKQAKEYLSNFCLANLTYFCDVLNFSSPRPLSGSISVLQAFMSASDDRYSVRSFSINVIVSFVSLTALLNVLSSWRVRVRVDIEEKCCVLR